MDKCESNSDSGCEKVPAVSGDSTEVLELDVMTNRSSADSPDFLHEKAVGAPKPINRPTNKKLEVITEIDNEAAKIADLQNRTESWIATVEAAGASSPGSSTGSTTSTLSLSDKIEIDSRSIFVGNVDYSATNESLQEHFHGCGSVKRVTILKNNYTGHPKGCAYIEFMDRESVDTAMALDESLFRGRQIKIMSKRTNQPGYYMGKPPLRGSRGTAGPGPIRGPSRGFPRGGRVARGYPRLPRQFRGEGPHTSFAPY